MTFKQITVVLLSAYLLVARAGAEQQEAKIVVVFGDSITAKSGKLPDKKWASSVEARSKGALSVVNEGKGGRPTDSVKEFDAMTKKQAKMDLLVIALGTNDSRDVSGNCVANAEKNILAMMKSARKTYGDKLPILLVGPTNINKDALKESKPIAGPREANLVALNAAYREMAKKEGCDFVSTYGVVPEAQMSADGVHPSAAGHDEIARVMLPAILKAVGVAMPDDAEPVPAPTTRKAEAAPAGLELRLWDGPAPNVPANVPAEGLREDGRVVNVSIPTLTAYLPNKKLANGTAIITCSGGGYKQLNLIKYADLGTQAFYPQGIAVFNLKYRLSPPSKNAREMASIGFCESTVSFDEISRD